MYDLLGEKVLKLECVVAEKIELGYIRGYTFHLCTIALTRLIDSSLVDHQLYAGDTQLFIPFSPSSLCSSITSMLDLYQPKFKGCPISFFAPKLPK